MNVSPAKMVLLPLVLFLSVITFGTDLAGNPTGATSDKYPFAIESKAIQNAHY